MKAMETLNWTLVWSLPIVVMILSGVLTSCSARVPNQKEASTIATSTEVTLHTGKKATVHYLLSVPETYNKSDKHPLMIFLHGRGERGNNLDRVMKHGPPKLVRKKNATGFIIVSPQCPKTEYWKIEKLSQLLDHILATTKADPKRVYLTGLSMGGFGTWHWGAKEPQRFAAAIPICGGGDPKTARQLINLPIWAFHGDKDKTVSLTKSQAMVNAIKTAGGTKVKLTIYPGIGHNSWTKTYNNPEIYKWLLKHRR
jgi:predicted peptidase